MDEVFKQIEGEHEHLNAVNEGRKLEPLETNCFLYANDVVLMLKTKNKMRGHSCVPREYVDQIN